MRRLQLLSLFCSPSILSASVGIFASFALLLFSNFSFLQRSNVLYDLIFSKGSSPDLIQASKNTFNDLNQLILGNALLNKILFFGLWMLIGLFAYAVFTTLVKSISETEKGVASLNYIHARKILIGRTLFLRLAIRSIALVAGLGYLWVFMRYLFPYCVFSVRIGLDELGHINGWLYMAIGYLVLLTALHGFVIILRLLTLRARLFGTDTD